jgi:hypothetical protein
VNDSYVTARIVGFDPAELAQLKADVAALKQENARLRSQGSVAPAGDATLETRVTALEVALSGLQGTLKLVVSMLTALLAKL